MYNNQKTLQEDFIELPKSRKNEILYSSKSRVSTNLNTPVTSSPEFSNFLNSIVKNCYELEEYNELSNFTEEKKRLSVSKFLARNWKEQYKQKRESVLRHFYCNINKNSNSIFEVNSNFTKANVNNLIGNCLPINMNCNNLNFDPQNTTHNSIFYINLRKILFKFVCT